MITESSVRSELLPGLLMRPEIPISAELERARKYLRECQLDLRWRRNKSTIDDYLKEAETAYLAALSWVWDAQERN